MIKKNHKGIANKQKELIQSGTALFIDGFLEDKKLQLKTY